MPVDAEAQVVLDRLAAGGFRPTHTLTIEEARAAHLARRACYGPMIGEPVASVTDGTYPTPQGERPLRIYRPAGTGPYGAVVFFHGGGFVNGSIETHDYICRAITNASGAMVVSVDYRRPPEDQFPAAPEDCFAATRWVSEQAGAIGVDQTRIAVAGDSAGGNLAAVVALMARDRRGPELRLQVLLYPVIDAAIDTPSYEANATGYLLTRDAMRWLWDHYLPSPEAGQDPYASPIRAADLSGVAPALVITAEYDPLRDEGEAYAARLRSAGVPVEHFRFDGMIHGFFEMPVVSTARRDGIRLVGRSVANAMQVA